MTDCLIIGFYDPEFEGFERMVRSMGVNTGAYRDLNLSFVNIDDKPYRSMEALELFYREGKAQPSRPFNNADFLWPVITYLTSYLNQRGFTADHVNLPHFEKDKLREKLLGEDILTIAITTTLYVAPHPILDIVAFIRQYNKTAKIIVGGPYVAGQSKTLDPLDLEEQFHYLGADFYVMSAEGELPLVKILESLKGDGNFDEIDNIAYRSGDRFVTTKVASEYNALEENMVNYGLFASEAIGQFVTLRTAKSCPFACAFCGFPERAGAYKFLSVELVEQELDAIAAAGGVTTLTFIDDTFNVPKQRFKDILRMMIRNKYGFKWNSFYRSDQGDDETIELMGESGCEGVILGIESGSDKILELMNKTSRRKHYLHAIPRLEAVGIACYASLIVGYPGETFDTMRETTDLLETAAPSFFRTQLWYADPLTPVYRQREQHGLKGVGFNWKHRTMDVETACDLIDRTFMSVENSIWLQQAGFELWSVFYLQRHGMPRSEVKKFLQCFNTAVKEKLLWPGRATVSPQTLEAIRLVSRFDEPSEPDMHTVEALAGARYTEAEQFCVREFGWQPSLSSLKELLNGDNAHMQQWSTASVQVELQPLADKCEAAPEDVLLAAYSLLLSRLSGVQDTGIVAALLTQEAQDAALVPLRLFPSWEMSFREFTSRARGQRDEAKRHEAFAFNILTNPIRMGYFGGTPPALDAGYFFSATNTPDRRPGMHEVLSHLPAVNERIRLVLKSTPGANGFDVRMEGQFDPALVERLASYLTQILEDAAAHPCAPLGEIGLANQDVQGDGEVDALAREMFSF